MKGREDEREAMIEGVKAKDRDLDEYIDEVVLRESLKARLKGREGQGRAGKGKEGNRREGRGREGKEDGN